MADELADYFRCVAIPEGYAFEVGRIRWDGPHTPVLEWITYRQWKTTPTEKRIRRAKESALRNLAFFGTCKRCSRTLNIGHMHDKAVCQSCAERELGIVH